MNYPSFCASAPDLPLFMQDWYLDAVCTEGVWEAAMVEKGGKVVGVWPFYIKRKFGSRYVAMPQLCRMLGPYIVPEFRGTKHETGIVEGLMQQWPTLAAFEQDCHYHFRNWLPLYWNGFRQTTRYSYVLRNTGNIEDAWNGLAADYRNNKIPKAQEQVDIVSIEDPGAFLEVHDKVFLRKKARPPITLEFLSRLDAALAKRKQRRIIAAADRQSGALHAVAYLAWDQQSAWLLMAGDDPDLRSSGAGVLTTWECIRFAFEELNLPVFDFAGSMIRPVERVRRQFGAVQQPYFRVQREWAALWRMGKRLWR